VDSRVQLRVQRYGWDRAAGDYEALWQAQLEPAHAALLAGAALAPGAAVLDVACGTGLVTLAAARAVGAAGRVLGTDLSGEMVRAARARAAHLGLAQARFERMDAQHLTLADGQFDVALCALGLMYVSEPEGVLGELRRVLRPGGRLGLAVWGERGRCGWASVFGIVQEEVASDVCPLFFSLGRAGALTQLCLHSGFAVAGEQRIATRLQYRSGAAACQAAFAAGPMALAWSRFGERTRARVCARYLASLEPWRRNGGYSIPGEFVVAHARAP